MSTNWRHPKLGTFKFDQERECWCGACSLPAFKAFHWELARVPSKYELSFQNLKGRNPSAAAINVAVRTIANEARLSTLVTSALWDEFNGRGPKSEMWWHGDMAEVASGFRCDGRPSPGRPGDLIAVMRFQGMTVRESLYKYKKPIAELHFSAVFEEEHGLGILTDGSTILGTGYMHDALPYKF